MAEQVISLTVSANPIASSTYYLRGDLQHIRLEYSSLAAVIVNMQVADSAGTWRTVWYTASTNTNADYYPSASTNLGNGVAGTAEATIPLTGAGGWRLYVTGATSGTLTAIVNVKQ